MELSIHNVKSIYFSDGENGNIRWRTIYVKDDKGNVFELCLFPHNRDPKYLHLKTLKSESEIYYDDAVQDHISEQQEEWLEEQSKTKEYEGWLDEH